ncbi:MAG: hypothetical protein Q9218_005561 [Villophora microphyllina]
MGGIDTSGIYWPGQASSGTFSQAIGRQLTNLANYDCSLEHPCNYQANCDDIGTRTYTSISTPVLRFDWGFFALNALQNINQQLNNQYVAIKGALGVLALDTFSISNFFPKPDRRFNIVRALSGLGTILSVITGIVPVGPGLAATGTILPAVGSFLGTTAASKANPLVGQQEFTPRVRELYQSYVDALDDAGRTLFNGGTVGAFEDGFNITGMMKAGGWTNSSVLTKLSHIETNLTVEILSRSIDALWKTPTSNKIYIEDGDKEGYVGYPWGGKLHQNKLGINLSWVTEASTESYRLTKKNNTKPNRAFVDPFNLTGVVGTQTFLMEAFNDNGTNIALIDQAGRYPGSWTLPVCDASTWGESWNWDYNRPDWNNDYTNPSTGDFGTSPKHQSHPPCICGENGSESDAWAKAAGMQDFGTFRVNCERVLSRDDFKWPDWVTEVSSTGSNNFTIKQRGSLEDRPPRPRRALQGSRNTGSGHGKFC